MNSNLFFSQRLTKRSSAHNIKRLIAQGLQDDRVDVHERQIFFLNLFKRLALERTSAQKKMHDCSGFDSAVRWCNVDNWDVIVPFQ